MDGDSSCPRGSSDDVTGGGETTALDTMENRGGHLGRGQRLLEKGRCPRAHPQVQNTSIVGGFGIGEIKSNFHVHCTVLHHENKKYDYYS